MLLPKLRTFAHEAGEPQIVFLHWLSGSSREWEELSDCLSERGFSCIALDLPGFGRAHDIAGFGVTAMRDAVISTLESIRAGSSESPWLLAGHSMGGKVAAAVARKAADGAAGLENLQGIVLFSPSPPAPEPMKESKRESMLERLGETSRDVKRDRRNAEEFVQENTGVLPLPVHIRDRAVEDVLQMNRTAFRMWLKHGSKEDWSGRVGVLPFKALVLAGSEEDALGADAQKELTLPHYASAELVTLKGAGHLIPMERPREATEHICDFAFRLGLQPETRHPLLDHNFTALMASDQTSPQTRKVMEERLAVAPDWEYTPQALTVSEFRTLRALASRCLPDAGFDAAAFIDNALAGKRGDGWRFADLPPDGEAWNTGLQSLDVAAQRRWKVGFIALDDARMDELLGAATEGQLDRGLLGALHLGAARGVFTAEQMKHWLEDVRSEFAKRYMAHPRTMASINFTGFADEGGFTQIKLGEQGESER